jgi:hypothetical protein
VDMEGSQGGATVHGRTARTKDQGVPACS